MPFCFCRLCRKQFIKITLHKIYRLFLPTHCHIFALLYKEFIILQYVSIIPYMIRIFTKRGYFIYQIPFMPPLRWSYNFCFCFCLCAIMHLLISVCWIIFASLQGITFGHGDWSILMCYWIWLASIYWLFSVCMFIKNIHIDL